MRSDQALRYVLLKHLWKLSPFTDRGIHSDVAKSLDVEQAGSVYVVSWTHRDGPHRLECGTDRFAFYKRGDVPDQKGGARPAARAFDNEEAARQLAAEILGIPLPLSEKRPSVRLYGDVWRWPLVCGISAVAGFVTSRAILPFVLAGTTLLEPRVRTYRLYFPLVAALVVWRYNSSAVLIGVALAAIVCLGSTTARGRADALGYLILAYLGWHFRSESQKASPDWVYIVPAVSVAACVWTVFWLSFEGPRLSILLVPLLSVSLFFDGHFDLALAYLCVCLIYSAWLAIPTALRESSHL